MASLDQDQGRLSWIRFLHGPIRWLMTPIASVLSVCSSLGMTVLSLKYPE